jgi:hypothetical protein
MGTRYKWNKFPLLSTQNHYCNYIVRWSLLHMGLMRSRFARGDILGPPGTSSALWIRNRCGNWLCVQPGNSSDTFFRFLGKKEGISVTSRAAPHDEDGCCVFPWLMQPLLTHPSGFNPGARATISYQQTFLRISTEIIIASLSLPPAPLPLFTVFFLPSVSASHAVIIVCVRA